MAVSASPSADDYHHQQTVVSTSTSSFDSPSQDVRTVRGSAGAAHDDLRRIKGSTPDKTVSPPPDAEVIDMTTAEHDELNGTDVKSGRYSEQVSPLEHVTPWSATYMNWLTPLIWNVARKRPIEVDDIWELTNFDSTRTSAEKLRREWHKEQQKARERNAAAGKAGKVYEPSLIKAWWRAFGQMMMRAGASESGYYGLVLGQPFAIKAIIEYLEYHYTSKTVIPNDIWYVLGLAATIFFGSFFLAGKFWFNYRYSNQARLALVAVIYDKALKISTSSRSGSSSGETVNVMSNDTARVSDAMLFANTLVICPSVVIIVAALIIYEIGVCGVAALVCMICIIPLQIYLGRAIQQNRRAMLKYSDERVKLMSEILSGIRVIKCYSWEEPMANRVNEARHKETRQIGVSLLFKGFNMSLIFLLPVVATFFTFLWYTLINGRPNNVQVFTVLAFLNIVRFPLSLMPQCITALADARIAIRRIQTFLLLDELHVHENTQLQGDERETMQSAPTGSIDIRHAAFSWSSDQSVPPTLSDIKLRIEPGQLVAVVGSVASGKSSLLNAILGEMQTSADSFVHLNGRVAYAAQKPWIRNATIYDNILFGLPYDEDAYINSIEAAALTQDLAIMPNADYTEIGEQGLNLSGGQKQRVSAARLLYRAAVSDIVLMDDPISAVDLHVGQTIFDQGIKTVLKGKTRMIVLNSHLHLLPQFDRIIVMESGKLAAFGTFSEIYERYPTLIPTDEQTLKESKAISNDGSARLQSEAEQSGMLSEDKSTTIAPIRKPVLPVVPIDGLSIPEKIRQRSQSNVRQKSQPGTPQNRARPPATPTKTSTNDIDPSQLQKPKLGRSKSKTLKAKLIQVEDRKTGAVGWTTYIEYAKASAPIMWKQMTSPRTGSIMNFVVILLLYCAGQALQVLSNYWLSLFASDQSVPYKQSNGYWLGSWAGIVGGTCVALVVRTSVFVMSNVRASNALHNSMFGRLLRAPSPTFYDVTPVGRIINRFSNDLDKIDLLLPDNLGSCSQYVFLIIAIIITSALATPYFLLVFIPILAGFYFIQSLYRHASRELKRLENITRSPIISLFGESLAGLTTIRACNIQQQLTDEFYRLSDTNGKVSLITSLCERWLAIRLEFLSAVMVLVSSLFVVTVASSIPTARLGISLIYALQMQGVLQIAVRQSILVETSLTSVERLLAYSTIDVEAPAHIPETAPPADWPTKGEIIIDNVKLRYRPELELVLKGVSLDVRTNEKVGVAGRTGSGKSTLMLALFRLVEPSEGKIIIDGIDVSKIGLHDLRSKLGIIPQDAVVFSGDIRYNIDPFGVHSDEELWQALERSNLAEAVRAMPNQLNARIADNGDNISHGQRQLLCIARALLRNAKILILDEATASIDAETDKLIQSTIRAAFADSTILTIAHRLETIIDYDRVMVMRDGVKMEMDTPAALLRMGPSDSLFANMLNKSGDANVAKLKLIAEETEQKNANKWKQSAPGSSSSAVAAASAHNNNTASTDDVAIDMQHAHGN